MYKKIIFLFVGFIMAKMSFSYNYDFKNIESDKIDSLINQQDIIIFKEIPYSENSFLLFNKIKGIKINKQKLTALILDILTGPVGGHRMALGTKPIVPIFYAITLGGGFFVLPAVDFFVILFTKDISKYQNNDKIIMWLK